jgi:hypothetical protein
MRTLISRACWLLALLCAVAISPARAAETPDDDNFYDGKIHVGITPYVWLPTINGQLRYNLSDIHEAAPNVSGTFDTSIGPNKYLSSLNFALMFSGQIRKGNVALISDFINLNAGNQTSSLLNVSGPRGDVTVGVTGSAQSHIAATLWTVGASGTLYHKENTSLDVLLGGRLVWMKASTDWQLSGNDGFLNAHGSASKNVTLGDAVVGAYGQYGLGKKWAIPYYIDVGTGDPNFTTQGLLGVKYGKLQVSYRYLYYGGNGAFVQNMRLNGPLVGYTLHF